MDTLETPMAARKSRQGLINQSNVKSVIIRDIVATSLRHRVSHKQMIVARSN